MFTGKKVILSNILLVLLVAAVAILFYSTPQMSPKSATKSSVYTSQAATKDRIHSMFLAAGILVSTSTPEASSLSSSAEAAMVQRIAAYVSDPSMPEIRSTLP